MCYNACDSTHNPTLFSSPVYFLPCFTSLPQEHKMIWRSLTLTAFSSLNINPYPQREKLQNCSATWSMGGVGIWSRRLTSPSVTHWLAVLPSPHLLSPHTLAGWHTLARWQCTAQSSWLPATPTGEWPGLHSRLLALAWLSLGCCKHLRSEQRQRNLSPFLFQTKF